MIWEMLWYALTSLRKHWNAVFINVLDMSSNISYTIIFLLKLINQ